MEEKNIEGKVLEPKHKSYGFLKFIVILLIIVILAILGYYAYKTYIVKETPEKDTPPVVEEKLTVSEESAKNLISLFFPDNKYDDKYSPMTSLLNKTGLISSMDKSFLVSTAGSLIKEPTEIKCSELTEEMPTKDLEGKDLLIPLVCGTMTEEVKDTTTIITEETLNDMIKKLFGNTTTFSHTSFKLDCSHTYYYNVTSKRYIKYFNNTCEETSNLYTVNYLSHTLEEELLHINIELVPITTGEELTELTNQKYELVYKMDTIKNWSLYQIIKK